MASCTDLVRGALALSRIFPVSVLIRVVLGRLADLFCLSRPYKVDLSVAENFKLLLLSQKMPKLKQAIRWLSHWVASECSLVMAATERERSRKGGLINAALLLVWIGFHFVQGLW